MFLEIMQALEMHEHFYFYVLNNFIQFYEFSLCFLFNGRA
jgi:hypothetical protein